MGFPSGRARTGASAKATAMIEPGTVVLIDDPNIPAFAGHGMAWPLKIDRTQPRATDNPASARKVWGYGTEMHVFDGGHLYSRTVLIPEDAPVLRWDGPTDAPGGRWVRVNSPERPTGRAPFIEIVQTTRRRRLWAGRRGI